MRILIAEDEIEMSNALVAILKHNNYSVDAVYNGQEALDYLETGLYDAAILDIMMPLMDGLTVLKRIRAQGISVPVLLLTARSEIDDRVTGLDAGADDYLTKPFAMKELLARVRSMTRRREDYSARDLSFAGIELDADNFILSSRISVRLSIREFELMKTLMLNVDRPLHTSYLLEHIWKNETDAGEDTVWLYISYLKGKLKAVDAMAAIRGEKGGSFRLEEIRSE